MSKPWFDADTGVLLLDEYVMEMPTFKKIMADEVVTTEEMISQAQRVTSLLRELEGKLSAEDKELVTQALCELAVLHALHGHHAERSR